MASASALAVLPSSWVHLQMLLKPRKIHHILRCHIRCDYEGFLEASKQLLEHILRKLISLNLVEDRETCSC